MGLANGIMTAVKDKVSAIANRSPCCTVSRSPNLRSGPVSREKSGRKDSSIGLDRIPKGAMTNRLAYPSAAAAPGMYEAKWRSVNVATCIKPELSAAGIITAITSKIPDSLNGLTQEMRSPPSRPALRWAITWTPHCKNAPHVDPSAKLMPPARACWDGETASQLERTTCKITAARMEMLDRAGLMDGMP